jgi:precorrin-6B methylase 2
MIDKQKLRSLLGDRVSTWVHAVRLSWLAMRPQQEQIDMDLVTRLTRPSSIAVDVGANGANWTMVLSRNVGRSGKVFAFEADPYYAEVTRKTIALLHLKNVEFSRTVCPTQARQPS